MYSKCRGFFWIASSMASTHTFAYSGQAITVVWKSSSTFLDNFKSTVDTQSNMLALVSLDSYKKIKVIANAVKMPQFV